MTKLFQEDATNLSADEVRNEFEKVLANEELKINDFADEIAYIDKNIAALESAQIAENLLKNTIMVLEEGEDVSVTSIKQARIAIESACDMVGYDKDELFISLGIEDNIENIEGERIAAIEEGDNIIVKMFKAVWEVIKKIFNAIINFFKKVWNWITGKEKSTGSEKAVARKELEDKTAEVCANKSDAEIEEIIDAEFEVMEPAAITHYKPVAALPAPSSNKTAITTEVKKAAIKVIRDKKKVKAVMYKGLVDPKLSEEVVANTVCEQIIEHEVKRNSKPKGKSPTKNAKRISIESKKSEIEKYQLAFANFISNSQPTLNKITGLADSLFGTKISNVTEALNFVQNDLIAALDEENDIIVNILNTATNITLDNSLNVNKMLDVHLKSVKPNIKDVPKDRVIGLGTTKCYFVTETVKNALPSVKGGLGAREVKKLISGHAVKVVKEAGIPERSFDVKKLDVAEIRKEFLKNDDVLQKLLEDNIKSFEAFKKKGNETAKALEKLRDNAEKEIKALTEALMDDKKLKKDPKAYVNLNTGAVFYKETVMKLAQMSRDFVTLTMFKETTIGLLDRLVKCQKQ